MAERAALRVLTRESHACAFHRERRERGGFTSGPIERLLTARHLRATLEDRDELRMHRETRGKLRRRHEELLQALLRENRRRIGRVRVATALVGRPFGPELRALVDVVLRLRSVEFGLESGAALLLDRVRVGARHAAELQQVVEVTFAHRLARTDRLVHQGLREARLVALVVTATPVGVHVDDDVAAPRLAEVHREANRLRDRLGVLTVHVQDRALQHARDVRRIRRAASVLRIRREPDLVVHDDVDRAADVVARQLRHVERLLHDALSCERRVAVDQQRQAGGHAALAHPFDVVARAHAAHRHGVDELQVTRVEAQGDRELCA